jgi:hypothetical protein
VRRRTSSSRVRTNPAGITVHGTQSISSTEVDATIDIADAASLAYFDIKVTNTTGRSLGMLVTAVRSENI